MISFGHNERISLHWFNAISTENYCWLCVCVWHLQTICVCLQLKIVIYVKVQFQFDVWTSEKKNFLYKVWKKNRSMNRRQRRNCGISPENQTENIIDKNWLFFHWFLLAFATVFIRKASGVCFFVFYYWHWVFFFAFIFLLLLNSKLDVYSVRSSTQCVVKLLLFFFFSLLFYILLAVKCNAKPHHYFRCKGRQM